MREGGEPGTSWHMTDVKILSSRPSCMLCNDVDTVSRSTSVRSTDRYKTRPSGQLDSSMMPRKHSREPVGAKHA